jgi:membrane protein YdbS with pleckstrin-like domain
MENFSNEPIDISSLPNFQEVQLDPMHPDYWKVIVLNICISLIFIVAVTTVFFLLNEEIRPYIIYASLIIIAFGAFLFVIFKLSFQRRGLAVREKDIIYRSGILSSKTTIVPFNRIQHVALNEGIFSRMYRLGALEVYTAGGATGNIKIHGMAIEQANRIKELLSKSLNNGI